MLHVVVTTLIGADCVAVRRGRDVVLLVAEAHLTARGASAMNAAIEQVDLAGDGAD